MTPDFDALRRTLFELRHSRSLPAADQLEVLADAARTYGGAVHRPQPGNTWDAQTYLIHLHGAYAEGMSDTDVIRNWHRVARNLLAGETEIRIRAAEMTLLSRTAQDAEAIAQAARTILDHPTEVSAETRNLARGVAMGLAAARTPDLPQIASAAAAGAL